MSKFRIIRVVYPNSNVVYRIQKDALFGWKNYIPYGSIQEDFSSVKLAEDAVMNIPSVKRKISRHNIVKEYNF